MKQKRRGFTLIELLAVIVILAIIALIAVPVIMNIISSARESAFEDTAYGLISAGEMYYASALLENGMTSDVEFTIEDGEFVGENKLEVKGDLPTSGKVKVTVDGKVALAISKGAMCITKGYDDSKINPEADVDNCELPKEPAKTLSRLAKTNEFATTVHACAAAGTTCTTGEKFAIEVAPNVIKNFYVVSDENNKVTLIMDRNIDNETVAWISEEDFQKIGGSNWSVEEEGELVYGNNNKGPISALDYLENQTNGWKNISVKDYILVDDQGKYTIQRINARSRMLTRTEALSLGCIEENYNCPSWLVDNLWSEDNQTLVTGYWLSSSDKNNQYGAWNIDSDGGIHSDYADVPTNDTYGVRPVIEISK